MVGSFTLRSGQTSVFDLKQKSQCGTYRKSGKQQGKDQLHYGIQFMTTAITTKMTPITVVRRDRVRCMLLALD